MSTFDLTTPKFILMNVTTGELYPVVFEQDVNASDAATNLSVGLWRKMWLQADSVNIDFNVTPPVSTANIVTQVQRS